jgi:D-aminopeptidase
MGRVNNEFEWAGDDLCDPIYEAAVQSVEEAVVNALIAAESMDTLRPFGFPCSAINPTDLVTIVNRYQR